jgi:peroxiredoxin
MRRIIQVATIAAGWLFFVSHAAAVQIGESFPTVEFKHYKSGTLDNKGLAGKVTIINFWATWCDSCKIELKEMEKKFATLQKEKDVNFAFVSVDKNSANAETWVNGNLQDPAKFLRHLYADESFAIAEKLDLDTFPMTFVIGKDGLVKHVQRGYKEGEPSTDAIVEKALAVLK